MKPPRTIAIVILVWLLAGCNRNTISVGPNAPSSTTTANSSGAPPNQPPNDAIRNANEDCDPNYAGGCVPIASDVDCAGKGGNGPAYVQGPIRVIGKDIYGLDRDGNGIACE